MARDNFIDAKKLVDDLNTAFLNHEKVVAAAAVQVEKIYKLYATTPSEMVNLVKDLSTETDKVAKAKKKLSDTEKQALNIGNKVKKQRLDEIRLQKQREQAFDRLSKKEQRERRARERQVKRESDLRQRLQRQREREEKQAERAAQQKAKESREYNKLSAALNNVRNDAKDVAAEMFRLEQSGEKNTEAYRKLDSRFQKLAKTTNVLDKGLKDIDKSLGQNQREVGNYAIATENLHPALGRVNSQLAMMGLSLDQLAGQGGFKAAMAAVKNFGRSMLTFILSTAGLVLATLGGLYALISRNKDTVIEFDRQLTNVGKTTGLAGDELSILGDDIIKLSRKLKVIGTPALLEYATVAGQLGVKGSENILAFTEALAKLETASNISGEEGASNIARLLTLTDGGVQNVGAFGDEIVRLGNNFAATESEILGNATAIGQNVAQYKFGRQDVLAFATATKAVGVEAELTGSTLGRTLGLMEQSLRTGKNIQVMTDLTGQSASELRRIFEEDSAQALQLLVKGLNGVSEAGGSVNEQLQAIGITSIRDRRVIGSLATKGFDVLELAINDVRTATGALDEEFGAAANNLENRLGKFSKAWDNLILTVEDGDGVFSKFFATLSEGGAWVLDDIANSINDINILINHGVHATRESVAAKEKLIATLKQEWKEVDGLVTVRRNLNEEYEKENDFFGLLRVKKNDLNEEEKQTVAGLQEEISELNKAIDESSTTDIEGIRVKQSKIKQLQAELDAILGVSEATKASQKLIEGSAKWLQAEIAALKQKRDETALTARETHLFNNEIEILEKQLEKLTSGLVLANSGLKAYKKDTKDALQPTTDLAEKLETAEEKATRLKNAVRAAVGNVSQSIGLLDGLMGGMSHELATLFVGISEGWENFGDEAERAAAITQAVGGIVIKSLDAIRNAQNINTQNQIENLERQKNVELEFAGESAAARGAIEERFAERKQELQEKQARNDKAMAIMQAVISTAVAVVNALKIGPAGIALASIIGALGAAQIAVIASTPIPQFAEGVQNFEGGQAIVGDGGKREPITDKSGRLLGISPNKPTLVDLPKGANVYPSEADFYRELNGVLSSNGIAPNISVSGNGLTEENVYHAMKKAIGNKPTTVINMDKNGYSTYLINKSNRRNIINNRAHFRIQSV